MNYDILFSNPDKERANFIAKILGIYSEDLVYLWTANSNCDYINLGRPDIFDSDNKKIAQLDFTLKNKHTDKCFIVEQKNLVAYNNGRIRHMTDTDSFKKSFQSYCKTKSKQTSAWNIFLGPFTNLTVKVKGQTIQSFGKILIWSKVNKEAESQYCTEFSIDQILCFEQIHSDLISWKDATYIEWLNKRMNWTKELFGQLLK